MFFQKLTRESETNRSVIPIPTYPAFTDDEEGVTARTLPDDVIALIVEALGKVRQRKRRKALN